MNLEYVNRRKGDVPRLICNSEKVRKSLNWIKKIKKMGLKRMFKNYNISKKIH